ncbi:MAG: hypothetical protein IJF38_01560 [Clostridia bacterium]|nr:hypothetical protein [Clostridia bacterium]
MKKRLFAIIFVLLITACALALTGCQGGTPLDPGMVIDPDLFDKPEEPSYSSPFERLDIPEGLSYDKETYTLSWKEVPEARGYTVMHRGFEIKVTAGVTSIKILPVSKYNTFKIMANDNGETNYLDSKWSEEYEYIIEEPTLFDRVNFLLGSYANNQKLHLMDITGISYADVEGDDWGRQIEIITKCRRYDARDTEDYDKQYAFVRFYITTDVKTSVNDILNSFTINNISSFITNPVQYNSSKYYAKSDGYDGEMQRLKNEGYEISAVSSYTQKGVGDHENYLNFRFAGTYKATRGDETLYFTSVNLADLHNPASGSDDYNYGYFLEEDDFRTVSELSFLIHEAGKTLEYMKDWALVYDLTDSVE